MMHEDLINPEHYHLVSFGVNEAGIHAQQLASELQSGCVKDHADIYGGLPVSYAHILDHICHSWHQLWLTDGEYETQSDDLFSEMCDAVPNWTGHIYLTDNSDDLPDLDLRDPGGPDYWCNITAMADHLIRCRVLASSLSHQLASTRVLPPFGHLVNLYVRCLAELCWSWHVKFIPTHRIDELTADQKTAMGQTILDWPPKQRRVVPLDFHFGTFDPYQQSGVP
ncbi:MAG: hypothetical protein WC058_12035 [Phycisphaeraceae bacterium]